MALFTPGETTCPLCGQAIMESDEIVGTTHFIGDQEDPLWPFSDAVMHAKCFMQWELRQVFVDKYNSSTMSLWHHMSDGGEIAERSLIGQAIMALWRFCCKSRLRG